MFRALPVALGVSLGIAFSLVVPDTVAAQTEFAVPLARGMLRVDITPDWLSYDHRFGLNVPGYADGKPIPINLDYSAESLGVAAMPFLQGLQNKIQAASGLGAFSLNLGRTVTVMNASVRTIPIGLEYGVTNRLTIGVTVPIVRSRMDVNFAVDTTAGKRGNVAFANPDSVAPFRTQVDSAIAALQRQAATGPPSLRAAAQSVLTQLQLFQYLAHGPLLPVSGPGVGDSVTGHLTSAELAYDSLSSQFAANGVTLPPLNTGLALPASAMTREDFERFFSDSTLPLAGDTLGTIVRTGLGDITAHATYQFAKGALYRGQIVVTTRFPTGGLPYTSSFLDLGTGTHQFAVEAALANDVLIGSNFLVHAVARAGIAKADDVARRIAPPDFPFAPIAQLATVHRKPGTWVGLEVAPTWMLDDAFSVRLTYSYYDQGQTHYTYVNAADAARIGMSASVLDQRTEQRLSRIGGGVTFSTLSRYLAGRASLPYTLTVSYENTVSGRGGWVPQASIFRIQLRAYIRLFGGEARSQESNPQ